MFVLGWRRDAKAVALCPTAARDRVAPLDGVV
jgi:hypothetical protein